MIPKDTALRHRRKVLIGMESVRFFLVLHLLILLCDDLLIRRGIISDAILELQELGTLQELKNTWWSVKKGGGQCGPKDGAQKAAGAASELGLANVGGVFVVLAGGSVIAIVICVSEFVWKMKQIPRSERVRTFITRLYRFNRLIALKTFSALPPPNPFQPGQHLHRTDARTETCDLLLRQHSTGAQMQHGRSWISSKLFAIKE